MALISGLLLCLPKYAAIELSVEIWISQPGAYSIKRLVALSPAFQFFDRDVIHRRRSPNSRTDCGPINNPNGHQKKRRDLVVIDDEDSALGPWK